jgi:probable DNA metabolism protein
MRVVAYDASFEGLLTVVFDAYARKSFPDALIGGAGRVPLLADSARRVPTDSARADRVFAGLRRALSARGLGELLLAWMAEQQGADRLILRYIRKVFAATRRIERDYGDADVFGVHRLALRTDAERRHLAGFVRFQRTAHGIYFAPIAPRCNVLPLLLDHFADRFADQDWIMYDTIRNHGVLHDSAARRGGRFREVSFDAAALRGGQLPPEFLAEEETLFQSAWRVYFETAAISERINPALQARCMPRRFWAYMTEMQPCTDDTR